MDFLHRLAEPIVIRGAASRKLLLKLAALRERLCGFFPSPLIGCRMIPLPLWCVCVSTDSGFAIGLGFVTGLESRLGRMQISFHCSTYKSEVTWAVVLYPTDI